MCALGASAAEDEAVKYADRCEVCKYVTEELRTKLLETGRSHDVIETGYNIEAAKKKKTYKAS